MQNTDKRIAALEAKVVTTDEFTIIRRIVRPGQLDAATNRLTDKAGTIWARETGETEDAFIERARRETVAAPSGVKSLIAKNLETCDAKH